MKVHLQIESRVMAWFDREALAIWERENLIPFLERACDGLMVKKNNAASLTKDQSLVTCKNCIKRINKKG